MHHQHNGRIARAFVDIMDAKARMALCIDDLAVMGREGEVADRSKGRIRRAQDFHIPPVDSSVAFACVL